MPGLLSSLPPSIPSSRHRQRTRRVALYLSSSHLTLFTLCMKLFCKVVFKREGGRAEKRTMNERDGMRARGFFSRVSERAHAFVLILRQYKLLIMRPAFMCLLIGPLRLLGKIDRSHDRPSLTPNALRARQGSV